MMNLPRRDRRPIDSNERSYYDKWSHDVNDRGSDVASATEPERVRVRYDQSCPVAGALEVIGEPWTLLILRDLLRHGPRRFHDLQESLTNASPTTISSRLKRLEARGVVQRRMYGEHPPRSEYLLTARGRALGPVMRELYVWGTKHTARHRRSPHP
jgi:DNA-binding HxlR family transcriptional regulator